MRYTSAWWFTSLNRDLFGLRPKYFACSSPDASALTQGFGLVSLTSPTRAVRSSGDDCARAGLANSTPCTIMISNVAMPPARFMLMGFSGEVVICLAPYPLCRDGPKSLTFRRAGEYALHHCLAVG